MSEDLLSHLNTEQREAVTHINGPLMIVAGAGTGKTTVVTNRIAWLIDQGHAKPEEILALTFTEKAASEMEERVDRLLPYGYVDLQISTFHSFAEKLLRQYGAELGLSRDFKLLTELDAWLLTRQYFDEFDLNYYRPLGNPTKYIKSLLTHFSRAKDSAIDPEAYYAYVEEQKANLDGLQADESTTAEIARLEELAGAYATYQNILLKDDALDFGDLMLYTLKLLQTRPHIKKELHQRFKFVLIDEFQDTNDAQYEIIKELLHKGQNVTVVGDDDQSIYKFRGASLANILQFEDDFPNAKQIVLTQNYRSAQEILDLSHAFIQHNNPNRLEANEQRTLSKKLQSNTEGKAVIKHIHARTLDEEVTQVVHQIVDLKTTQQIDWSDVAILVRSNSIGMDFASALDQYKIPYQFLALSGLYTKSSIMDLMAYLRVIDNPFDSPNMYRLLTSPMCDVSDRTILELNRLAQQKGKSLFEACEKMDFWLDEPTDDSQNIQHLLKQIESFQEIHRTKPVGELFIQVSKESGYLTYLNQLPEQKKLDQFSYLQQFYQRMKSFERRHEQPVLHHFLTEFDNERAAGEEGSLSIDLESGPDMVRVMTIHAAKGLEFKYVFIVNLVAQKFPTNAKSDPIPLPEGLIKNTHDKQAHLEEERRLFYVAVTRAKMGLYLTSAEDYGGKRKRKLSRFLHEIGYDQPQFAEQVMDVFDEDRQADSVSVDQNESVNLPVPKQFSFTQLAAFKTCPLQYKFAHVLKIPVAGKWTFSYGKTMHNTLQEFFIAWLERSASQQTSLFEQEAPPAPTSVPVKQEELMEMYQRCWQDEWYVNESQREKYHEQGLISLNAFYRQVQKDIPRPLSIEQGFTMKFGDVVLKGRIDRIDQVEGGVEIIDYKTGKPKTQKSISKEDKEQLFLYQLAARDVLGLNPVKLTYIYLEDNTHVSFLGSDEDLLSVQESVVNRVQEIKNSKFEARPGFPQCKFCDFSDICEFRSS